MMSPRLAAGDRLGAVTVFVGIDLAWSNNNASGICVLLSASDGLRCDQLWAERASTPALALQCTDYGSDVIVAVDAPLLATNQGSRRRCEVQLGEVFQSRNAGAHSFNLNKANGLREANDSRPATPQRAGLDLGIALESEGFSLDPWAISRRCGGKHVFEAFPHPAHVVFFGLDKSIPYKSRKGRDQDFRRGHFAFYQDCVRAFLSCHAPELLYDTRVAEVLSPSQLAPGRHPSKSLEDRVDALSCALIAAMAWRCGLSEADIFGERGTGHIVVPGLSRDPRFTGPAVTVAVQ